MKVLVAVKRVVDFNVRIRVKSDGSGVDTDNVVMSMNPFDENALEEALRMKQACVASEIVAVTIGDDYLKIPCAKHLQWVLIVQRLLKQNNYQSHWGLQSCWRRLLNKSPLKLSFWANKPLMMIQTKQDKC
jgi:hypothetical protein